MLDVDYNNNEMEEEEESSSSDDSDSSSDSSSSSSTEVSEQSWGERLKASIGGVLFGIVLFLASFVILWKNEGNLVNEYKKYGCIKEKTVTADSSKVDAGNNEKLVILQGKAETTAPAEDDQFKFTLADAFRIERQVEMYQWKETSQSKTEKKVGGKEVKTTTYTWKKEWSSSEEKIQSKDKKRPPSNPAMQYKGASFTAKGGKLGAFTLSPSLIGQVSKTEDASIDVAKFTANLPAELKNKIHKSGNPTEKVIYFGDPSKPKIGDYRISYKVAKASNVTVVAQQNGSNLVSFNLCPGGKAVEELHYGPKSKDDIVKVGKEGASFMAWILRLVGFICMAVGIYLVFNPLVVLADVLPFLGSLLGFGIGLFAGIIAFALSLVTIAIAWLAARPIISIPLLVIGIGGLVAYKILGAKKKEA